MYKELERETKQVRWWHEQCCHMTGTAEDALHPNCALGVLLLALLLWWSTLLAAAAAAGRCCRSNHGSFGLHNHAHACRAGGFRCSTALTQGNRITVTRVSHAANPCRPQKLYHQTGVLNIGAYVFEVNSWGPLPHSQLRH